MYTGELISLSVTISWTICALFAEVASKRMESLPFNVVRMVLSLLMIGGLLWCVTGFPYPTGADSDTWLWLSLSGFVGYVLGDFCLFNCYIHIGSRYGQLLMTIAPPTAAIFGWLILGQQMSVLAILGMLITVSGIALAIHRPKSDETKLSTKGILYGIGAAIGQGIGLVLSAKGLKCFEVSAADIFSANDHTMLALPFAGTMIRAITGLIGFTVWSLLIGKGPGIIKAFTDGKGMLFAIGAAVTGPFIGVGLSLMATQYTSTGIAQTIMSLTPIFILLPTYLFFHQKITWREIAGAVVAVGGVTLFFV
ncbi:MAG: DMT family transporter [Bacteroidales bacterium]|nr:DMT family transporter [Bacteroidales bacterium]